MPRCKPGDLAVILHDVPSCTMNIGRVVSVSGPSRIDPNGRLAWLVYPINPEEPYAVNNWDGSFSGFMGLGDANLEQPDEWMMPIRPDEFDDDGVEQEALDREMALATD